MNISIPAKALDLAAHIAVLTEIALVDDLLGLPTDQLIQFKDKFRMIGASLNAKMRPHLVRKIPDTGPSPSQVKQAWDQYIADYTAVLDNAFGLEDTEAPRHGAYVKLKGHLLYMQSLIAAEQPS